MNFQSHGLGLNICKRIAERLGGDLSLNQNVVGRTEFVLKLPVEVITPAKLITPQSSVK
jgi:signal transduction histidine kinase